MLNVASAINQNGLTILGAGNGLPDNAAGAEFHLAHELESKQIFLQLEVDAMAYIGHACNS